MPKDSHALAGLLARRPSVACVVWVGPPQLPSSIRAPATHRHGLRSSACKPPCHQNEETEDHTWVLDHPPV